MFKRFDWTDENVTAFWSVLRTTPLAASGFAETAGPRLVEVLSELMGQDARTILDFGCGVPVLGKALARLGFSVTAFDPAVDEKYVHEIVENLKVTRDTPDGKFDVIIVSEVIEHLLDKDLSGCYELWKSLLAPNGRVIITTPNAEDLRSSMCLCPQCSSFFHRMQHVRSVSLDWLKSFFPEQDGWHIVHTGRYDFSTGYENVTAFKRFMRYQPAMEKKINELLHQARADGKEDQLGKFITDGLMDIWFGGTLNDAGFDHSEGAGNVLIYVTDRITVDEVSEPHTDSIPTE